MRKHPLTAFICFAILFTFIAVGCDNSQRAESDTDKATGNEDISNFIMECESMPDRYYVTNNILLVSENGSEWKVASAVKGIGGEILEGTGFDGCYTIIVPESTEAKLLEMCSILMSEHPKVIDWAGLNYLSISDGLNY